MRKLPLLLILLASTLFITACDKEPELLLDMAQVTIGIERLDDDYDKIRLKMAAVTDTLPAEDAEFLRTAAKEVGDFRASIVALKSAYGSVGKVVIAAEHAKDLYGEVAISYHTVKSRYCADSGSPATLVNCPAINTLPGDLQADLITADENIRTTGLALERLMRESGSHDVTDILSKSLEIAGTVAKVAATL